MKVYIIINRLGIFYNKDIIEHVFLHEEDAIIMLESLNSFYDDYIIEEHEVIT